MLPLKKYSRLIPSHISLIHCLIEVIIYLLALFIDHSTSLVDNFNLLALLSSDCDLQAFLVFAYIINLFFEVNY